MVVAIKKSEISWSRASPRRSGRTVSGRADKVIRERPTPSPSAAEAIARTGLVGDGNRRAQTAAQLQPRHSCEDSCHPVPRSRPQGHYRGPPKLFPARSLASATSSRSPSIAVLIYNNTMRAVS